MKEAEVTGSSKPRANFGGKALAFVSALALVIALMPATAFAEGASLEAGTGALVVSEQTADLAPQALAAAKSAKKTSKKKAAFKIKKYKKTKKYKYATGKWSFSKPVIKGKSSIAKKINKSLAKRCKTAKKSKRLIMNYAKTASKYQKGSVFNSAYATKATYNANGYVSFRYTWSWYAGGVANNDIMGDVYSLKTGKKLSLLQVVSGSESQVKSQITKAVLKKYPGAPFAKAIAKRKVSFFEFYLEGGDVVVALEPYTVPAQRSAITVTLKGNYA